MPVTTRIFDKGSDAWREVADRGSDGVTIVCAQLARAKVLATLGGITFGREAISEPADLFELVGDRLRQPPPRPSSELVRLHALRELLTDMTLPAELTDLRARGADRLLAWIDRVEERADRDHREQARTPVECGVEQLRDALTERGLLSPGGWRARVARRAKEVRPARRVRVAPQDLSDPAFSGLLKGLAAQREVEVLGLAPRSGVPGWLELARLGPTWDTDPPSSSGTRADAIGAFGSARAGAGGLELVAAGDELEAALGLVEEWTASGVPAADIAIVSPQPAAALAGLEERSLRRGVPILGLVRAEPSASPLGAAAAALLVDPDDPTTQARARAAGAAEELLRALAATPEGPARVRALAELLQRTAVSPDAGALAARELHLAEALIGSAAEAAELEPMPAAAEIVAATRGRARLVGDPEGVAVVGYPHGAGLARAHLILTGLSADRWPPALHPTPFATPELLALAPGLGPRDRRAEFSACLCAAERAVLVREARDGYGRQLAPSVLWVAAEAAGAVARPSPERARGGPRARAGRQADDTSERARVAVAERRRFSVEEVGSYLRCPRGWFAEYVLPRAGADPEAARGEAAHAALAAAFDPALDERIDPDGRIELARAVLEEHADAGLVPQADGVVLLGRCRAVIERYSPPVWPFRTVAVERNLALPTKDRATLITGRLDRIDQNEHGAIVIDYKLNREPRMPSFGGLLRDPQATLYSLMVDRRLKLKALGVLFVSLARADHDGLVAGDQGPWGSLAYRASDLLWNKGAAAVMEAIAGMRAGRIERSPFCPRECPCRRFSWDRA